MNNSTLIQALADKGVEGDTTVAELIQQLETERVAKEEARKEHEQSIVEKYSNKIFARRFDTMFGKCFQVIMIARLDVGDLTTEYERLYDVVGMWVEFGITGCYNRNSLNGDKLHLTEKELEKLEETTLEEFNHYKSIVKNINKQINDIRFGRENK